MEEIVIQQSTVSCEDYPRLNDLKADWLLLKQAVRIELLSKHSKMPISILQEILNRHGFKSPEYQFVLVEGLVHKPVFTYRVNVEGLIALGCGKTKKEAKHAAAKGMLDFLLRTHCKESIKEGIVIVNKKPLSEGKKSDNIDNPIGLLQDLCVSRGWPLPLYTIVKKKGLPHSTIFTIACEFFKHKEFGNGKTIKDAKRMAAIKMCKYLLELSNEDKKNSQACVEEISQKMANLMKDIEISALSDMEINSRHFVPETEIEQQFESNNVDIEEESLKSEPLDEVEIIKLASSKTPISLLQELTNRRRLPQPKYEIDHIDGAIHELVCVNVGELTAVGTGRSKKEAKLAAAKGMLDLLSENQYTDQLFKKVNADEEPLPEEIKPPLTEEINLFLSEEINPFLSEEIKPFLLEEIKPSLPKKKKPFLSEEIELSLPEEIKPDKKMENPIGWLQEMCLKRCGSQPRYKVVNERESSRKRLFTVSCEFYMHKKLGRGKTKKTAKKKAALEMCQYLQEVLMEDNNPSQVIDKIEKIPEKVSNVDIRLNPNMSLKRKRVVLSLKDKFDIIEALHKGESGRTLAEKYGVGTSTISDIKKNRKSIIKFSESILGKDRNLKRKVMKKPHNENVDEAVYNWFVQKKASGETVSGPLLCEQALIFNENLNGDPKFKASVGWLGKFKARHGIKEIHGEILPTDVSSVNDFTENLKKLIKEENYNKNFIHNSENSHNERRECFSIDDCTTNFKKMIEEENYDEDFIYNADETGLHWKTLPNKSMVPEFGKLTSECKNSPKRVTLLICSNASGKHKLPVFLIGKSKNPRCFRNIKNELPIIYNYQEKGWMNEENFIEWFTETFIPEVKKYQNKIEKKGKILLLIDNAPSHPSEEFLNKIDENVRVKFFSPNIAILIQPMDQGVKEMLKQQFRKQLLQRLLIPENKDEASILTYLKKMNLKDCCFLIAESWSLIEKSTIKNSFNKLFQRFSEETIQIPREEINQEIKHLSFCKNCTEDDINEWLNCDADDQGFQVLKDEEDITKFVSVEMKVEDDKDSENENSGPSHDKAFQCLRTAVEWFEKQEECESQQLSCLKRICSLAENKSYYNSF